MKHLITIAALALSVSCAAQTQEQETTKTEYPKIGRASCRERVYACV